MKILRVLPLLLLSSCIGRCTGNDIDAWQINYCAENCKDHSGLNLIELRSADYDKCVCNDGKFTYLYEREIKYK